MQNRPENLYEEWFRKAQDDEQSIRALMKEKGPPSTICFLSQQMAEKYLKGFLIFHRKDFLKIHDLLGLETQLIDIEPDIHKIHNDINLLNRYYIETRYPGEYPEFTYEEAIRAFEAAQRVKKFVTEKIRKIN